MNKVARLALFTFIGLGSVACAPTSPATSTPTPARALLPTVVVSPTRAVTLLPTATAIPLPPTVTPALSPTLVPAFTPTPATTPVPPIPAGLYVTALRTEPQPPLRGVDLAFYPTFLNTTGVLQNYRWNVYLYRADNLTAPFGEAAQTDSAIPVGSSEFKNKGTWKIPIGGPCENFIARVVFFDQNNRAQPFAQPDGARFQQNLTICALADWANYPTPTPLAPTPTMTPGPGVFVIDVRTQPDPPVRNTEINFFVTFVNTTGRHHNLKWVVYLYRPGEPKAFGQTTGAVTTFYSTVDEAQSAGYWKLSGGGPCEDFVVRAAWFDQEDKAVFFTNFDGRVFEKTIRVCP